MKVTRELLDQQLCTLFHIYGLEGTTIARLAERMGLQKSSLYHYYPDGKDSMARAVLEQYLQWEESFNETAAQGPGSPRERLERILANIRGVNTNPAQVSTLDVFTIGEARERYLPWVQALYEKRRALLAKLATEAGIVEPELSERLDLFFIQFEGAHVMFRVLGNFEQFHRTLDSLPNVLLGFQAPTSD